MKKISLPITVGIGRERVVKGSYVLLTHLQFGHVIVVLNCPLKRSVIIELFLSR